MSMILSENGSLLTEAPKRREQWMGEWVYGIKETSSLPWSLLLTMLALTFLPAPLENVITPKFPLPCFSLFKFFQFDKGNQKELKEIPSLVVWLFLRAEKLIRTCSCGQAMYSGQRPQSLF